MFTPECGVWPNLSRCHPKRRTYRQRPQSSDRHAAVNTNEEHNTMATEEIGACTYCGMCKYVCNEDSEECGAQCSVYSVVCTMQCVQCSVYSVVCTV